MLKFGVKANKFGADVHKILAMKTLGYEIMKSNLLDIRYSWNLEILENLEGPEHRVMTTNCGLVSVCKISKL